VDLAEFGFPGVGGTCEGVSIRRVERQGDGAHAERGDFGARAFERIGLDVG
jgi:hypothetical protein